jgi:hypothetical protein
MRTPKMGLEQTHKDKFKVKSMCTNQKKKMVSANWNKMVHKWIMCNPTQKTHHDPNLGGIIIFLLIVYIASNGGHYVEMGKNLKKNG